MLPFYELKVCGKSMSSNYINAIFPTAFAHILSLWHFDNSCSVSNFFIIIIFAMVICDQWLQSAEKKSNAGEHFLAIKFSKYVHCNFILFF